MTRTLALLAALLFTTAARADDPPATAPPPAEAKPAEAPPAEAKPADAPPAAEAKPADAPPAAEAKPAEGGARRGGGQGFLPAGGDREGDRRRHRRAEGEPRQRARQGQLQEGRRPAARGQEGGRGRLQGVHDPRQEEGGQEGQGQVRK